MIGGRWDMVRITLMVTALNDLEVKVSDVQMHSKQHHAKRRFGPFWDQSLGLTQANRHQFPMHYMV